MIILLPLFMLLLPLKSFAQANCVNMQLQLNQTSFDLASSQTVNPTMVVKANTNPGGCDFFVTFGYGQASSFSSRSLRNGLNMWPFQLSKDAGGTQVLKQFPDISSFNDVLTGTLVSGSNNTQVSVNYWGALNMANPWLPTGSYEDNFLVSLYKGSPFSVYSLIESETVTFRYTAQKRVDISIVPTGGAFNINDTSETLNFGTLASGVTRSADAVIKYNAGYILKASSANNGQLKHEAAAQFISYAMTFNGVNFGLSGTSSSPTPIYSGTGQSPASGLRIPMSVTVGSIAGKQSGVYKDTITLTVESAE